MNISFLLVAAGWAKVTFFSTFMLPTFVFIYFLASDMFLWLQVRDQGQQKGEVSPFLAELLRLEEQAKQQGLGHWNRVCLNFFLHNQFPVLQYVMCSISPLNKQIKFNSSFRWFHNLSFHLFGFHI